jgi:hypothetical protein
MRKPAPSRARSFDRRLADQASKLKDEARLLPASKRREKLLIGSFSKLPSRPPRSSA